MLLLQWFETYRRNYTITGIAEIISPRETKYLWDDQAKNYRPQADAIFVLKRNAASHVLQWHKTGCQDLSS
jgi:hypothetical protein